RAQYGKALLHRLAEDLTSRFGKGFSERNLLTMREFYRAWSIPQTMSAELTGLGSTKGIQGIPRTASAESEHLVSRPRFQLPWSHLRPTPLRQKPTSPVFLRKRSTPR